jgi:ADP-ribose pyrophosphatase YjhB (NUDIX family)
MQFPVIDIRCGSSQTRVCFESAGDIPALPITCVFAFARYGDRFVLVEEAGRGWNPVGGHIEAGETWQDALRREAFEEAGVALDAVEIVGYLRCDVVRGHTDYPPSAAILVTTARATKLHPHWPEQDAVARGLFTFDDASEALGNRADANQFRDVLASSSRHDAMRVHASARRVHTTRTIEQEPPAAPRGIWAHFYCYFC